MAARSALGVLPVAAAVVVAAGAAPKCADLVVTYDIWGAAGKGIDVERFTDGTMKWIGCGTGAPNTCSADTFFCEDLVNGIRFGTTAPADDSHPMRAQLGDKIPKEFTDCEPWQPSGMVNSPDKQDDVEVLCQQMGFKHGTLEDAPKVNFCPDARWKAKQNAWVVGEVDAGYGRTFRCDDLPAIVPPTIPAVPAVVSDKVPENRLPGGALGPVADAAGKWAAGSPDLELGADAHRLPAPLLALTATAIAGVAGFLVRAARSPAPQEYDCDSIELQ